MSTQVRWAVQDRVIGVRYGAGELSIDDVLGAIGDSIPMINRGKAPVYTIINMVDVTNLGFSINSIASAPVAQQYYTNPSVGWTVYTGRRDNPFYQFVAAATAQSFEAKMRWVDSEDEALEFLKSVDPTL